MSATVTIDGNEAAATVAYQASEVIAIYPITPSSAMGESADEWAASHRPNAWGTVPHVIEMQSEGGAVGAVHGALQAGALCTTFTASQGLLLMIPNMYKIAGELTPTVFHVAARALAAQALSIFGDHSDVMAARQTGFAMLASGSVQEAMDLALVAHAATLESRVPFLHFFDGFRTSHEVAKIAPLTPADVRALLSDELVRAHRGRALSPDHPVIRGTAQNPDVYFQARETVNPYYLACPTIVENAMARLAERVGRQYHLFDYVGAPDAERVVVLMGSGAGAVQEVVEQLAAQGEKVGMVMVRLYRPFSGAHLLAALPPSVQSIAVLDRTKEPGSVGEPLYLDVMVALAEAGRACRVIGGRYGLSSKEFTPGMVKAVYDELAREQPRRHFTIGIHDDVTHTSLPWDPDFTTEDPATVRAVFYGLGSDGTVGANKSAIKIIGEETANHAQGYFVYDSKKSGSTTVSHLRFGPRPIRSTYLIQRASFVACHQFSLLELVPVLAQADEGATFLLNSPFGPEAVWDRLPRELQETILAKRVRFFVIDAYQVARDAGMGGRINTVMQTCFFALSGVLPRDEAIAAIKHAIEKTYGRRGEAVVQKNCAAVDVALAHLHEVAIPAAATSRIERRPAVPAEAPAFVREVTARLIDGQGDALPVSALPVDGTYPTGTAQWEKRALATEVPVWDEAICIQCGKCVLVCPHAVIRAKVYPPEELVAAPPTWKSHPARWKGDLAEQRYTLQVSPDDCTACRLCIEICPVKNKSETRLRAINMAPLAPIRAAEQDNWRFFLGLDDPRRDGLHLQQVKDVQLLTPLIEFSGACSGCGETPYLKLMSQLFGDRALVANATGCSSIYGGNLPTTPWTVNADGRGPAWSNSLFEDNAEFGLGMRLARDKHAEYADELLGRLAAVVGEDLVAALRGADQSSEAGIAAQRGRVEQLRERLHGVDTPEARDLASVAESLVRCNVWIVGGDGWAYDIGYGGLDHVLASGRNVNVLVLDTEVYSNTGGQMSKATPRGAVAKFAAGGKALPKKDLGLLMMTYGHIYVASVAMGADDMQCLKAFREAEAYDGPSLVIAYSHCIAHGYDLVHGLDQQKAAVASGAWPLYRYDPRLAADGASPLQLDAKPPSLALKSYAYNETRYTMLAHADPEAARRALALAEEDVRRRWNLYHQLAAITPARAGGEEGDVIDLSTRYLGLALLNPLVVSASPLGEDLDLLRRAEDAGAGALVLPSLFEEQLTIESQDLDHHLSHGTESFAEALSYFPDVGAYRLGPDGYLEHVRRAKAAVDIPVIGSLNGVSSGGWIEYARLIQDAGADALELNVYFIPTDPTVDGAAVERMYEELVRDVRASVRIPVAVKLGPFFSALANLASRLVTAGADGLVLFNRFYQPDLDIERLEVVPNLRLSTNEELRLRLRWVAILRGHIAADLAVTGGVHSAEDVLKAMMAGASVAMMTSALLTHGVEHLTTVGAALVQWMDEHEYVSIQQMQGSMSQRSVAEPAAFERANYLRVLRSYALRPRAVR